jgi:hypothetical protein
MSKHTAPIARSVLTSMVVAHLVTELADNDIIVGRGSAPPKGGWEKGQPGEGDFTSYVTVKTGRAVIRDPDPIGRNRMSWSVDYALTSTGMLESHADDVADQVREAIVALEGPFVLRGVEWTLQKVDVPQLGPTSRNDSTDPPFWEVTDAVSLWLSRSRAS